MRNQMKTLRGNAAGLCYLAMQVLGCFAISIFGFEYQSVFAQQSENAANSDPKQAPSDKPAADKPAADNGSKLLTKRPDPRIPVASNKQEPKTERQLAEERKARDAARKNGEITFDDLKFEMEKDAEFEPKLITKEIKELDKKTVKLRGFILPTSVFQQNGIKQFVLVRDNQECCFGPGAAIYDCVMIDMAPGKTTNFATRVVTVKGKFEIDTKSYQYPEPDGGYYAIYRMTAEEVK